MDKKTEKYEKFTTEITQGLKPPVTSLFITGGDKVIGRFGPHVHITVRVNGATAGTLTVRSEEYLETVKIFTIMEVTP